MPSGHHGITVLNGRHRADGAGPSEILLRRFGDSPVTDFSFPNQLRHGFRNGLRLHLRIDPVLIVQIDVIRSQPFQAFLHALPDDLRAAVHPQGEILIVVDSHLCGDHHLIPYRSAFCSGCAEKEAPSVCFRSYYSEQTKGAVFSFWKPVKTSG